MQDKHLCWPPYFFLGPAVGPYFLSSRIATTKASYYILKRNFNDGKTFILIVELNICQTA